jgi:glycosyltransferase involved in cell wall biosynthesis
MTADMHVLFVHQTYPSQFGPVAEWMSHSKDHRVTFLSTDRSRRYGAIENVHYEPLPAVNVRRPIPWTREFEMKLRHCRGVMEALTRRRDIRPDLVVGHSGFGSTLLIPEVLDCPIVNYFEYFMHARRNDMLYRWDFDHPDWFPFWRRAANTMFLLDLENCCSGYSPTRWQRNLLPKGYRSKVKVIFDGIDTTLFRPLPKRPTRVGKATLPPDVRVVTYVARGLEPMRGFDVFMKVAKRIYTEYPGVKFVVAGHERMEYSPNVQLSGHASFKKWVLKQDSYDLSKFHFSGWLRAADLVKLLNRSDLHIYLTTPFPLSWSLFNALACGATVLASDTEPVRELITHGGNGLLGDFFDVDGLVEQALRVLRDPAGYRELGKSGVKHIRQNYSVEVVVPELLRFFEENASGGRSPQG